MTYSEKSTRLASDASVAVLVMMGSAPDDVEFLPLKPRTADEKTLADLRARWPGRGLRSVGIIGLVGTSPQTALKEPLEPEQTSALAFAFLTYIRALFADSFEEQREGAEIQALKNLWSLGDSRSSPSA